MAKRVLLHVHAGGRRVLTRDLSPPSLADQYQNLLERLMAALAVHGHKTEDKAIAAGVACVEPGGSVLLLRRRTDAEDHPGEWAFPAGGVEGRETPEQAAARELKEETGHDAEGLEPFGTYTEPGIHFTCFWITCRKFEPTLCREHSAYVWARPGNLPSPLHPGVAKLLIGKTTTHDDAEAGKDDKLGHWLTLNGAHVFVNGEGTITKGPAHLVGKNKNDSVDTTQAKPVAPAKGVKAIVHQLLTTGHPFSFDELKSATGAKLNQQLHNAINELKAGKGALGSLMIQKVGGHYQVVKPDGTPAAALETMAPGETKANEVDPFENFTLEPIPETPKEDLLVKKPTVAEMDPMTVTPEEWNAAIAAEKATAAEETQPPTPAAPTAPSPPPAPPSPTIVKAPTEKMTKEAADADYTDSLADANTSVAVAFEMYSNSKIAGEMPPEENDAFLHELAKTWKQDKATAMAQWAANVKGGDHAVKPVEVFPADIKLVQALGKAGGDSAAQAKAVSDWKSATAQAKANAKAPPVTEGKAAAQGLTPKADTTPTGGHTLSAPEVIVPADHKHITKDDFAGEDGYVNQISKAHKALHGSASESASANKAHVQQQLEKRLSASPHFAEMEKQFKANGGVSLASSMIQAWAGSSGDHQPRSVAAQLAIRDVFKMHPDEVETKAFHLLSTSKNSEEDVYKQAAQAYGIDVKTPAKLESFKAGLRDFALAQYHETQDHLAKLGIKEMFLIRGMKFGSGDAGPQEVNVKLQPASSFTTAHSTARSFAGGHSLFAVKVPASQILSSFVTGFGCTGESEVVVLNHPSLQAIQIGSKNASSATSMASAIKTQLGGTSKSVGPPDYKGSPTPESVGFPKFGGSDVATANSAYEHAVNGNVEALKSLKEDYEVSHSQKLNDYVDQLLQHLATPKAKKTTTKTSGKFKPTNLPEKTTGMSTKWYTKLTAAAKAGDLDQLEAYGQEIGSLKLPNTKKHFNALMSHVQSQHAEHQAKQVNQASHAQPGAPVKKNAYYYKKLKDKILAHPEHTEAGYKMGKSQGMTNEEILAQYEKVHAQNTKEY